MTIEEKIGQLVITKASDFSLQYAKTNRLGGIFVQLQSSKKEDYLSLIKKLNENSEIRLFVMTDSEFGDNDNLKSILSTPPACELSLKEIGEFSEKKSKLLKELGFNVELSPVMEINETVNSQWTGVGCRSFGSIPRIENFSRIYMDSLKSNNITPTLKHFPGGTLRSTDSHAGISFVDINEEDIAIFKDALGQDSRSFVMTSHMVTTGAINSSKPASVSKETLDRLREFFGGIVITDDLQMNGVRAYYSANYTYPSSSCEIGAEVYADALIAGNDLLLDKLGSCNQNVTVIIEHVKDSIKKGLLSEQEINNKVKKVLQYKGYEVVE